MYFLILSVFLVSGTNSGAGCRRRLSGKTFLMGLCCLGRLPRGLSNRHNRTMPDALPSLREFVVIR